MLLLFRYQLGILKKTAIPQVNCKTSPPPISYSCCVVFKSDSRFLSTSLSLTFFTIQTSLIQIFSKHKTGKEQVWKWMNSAFPWKSLIFSWNNTHSSFISPAYFRTTDNSRLRLAFHIPCSLHRFLIYKNHQNYLQVPPQNIPSLNTIAFGMIFLHNK
jgi:hypothetical protein